MKNITSLKFLVSDVHLYSRECGYLVKRRIRVDLKRWKQKDDENILFYWTLTKAMAEALLDQMFASVSLHLGNILQSNLQL